MSAHLRSPLRGKKSKLLGVFKKKKKKKSRVLCKSLGTHLFFFKHKFYYTYLVSLNKNLLGVFNKKYYIKKKQCNV